MTVEERISAFIKLKNHLDQMSEDTIGTLCETAQLENPWFTPESVITALNSIRHQLTPENLYHWTKPYNLATQQPKTIALILAGNIPLVGFHDFLSVLISGHKALIKPSSKDSKLLLYLIKHLVWLEPRFEKYIDVQVAKLEKFDAVIATGGDNTSRYFEQYFGKYPHIIRKNRTSCAILTGKETPDSLNALARDVFTYYGLGCRNVSKVFVPEGYDFNILLSSWDDYSNVIHLHKYANNYDYQKSILLVNKTPFLDNGFVLLQQNERLVSPISVLYYEYYAGAEELTEKLEGNADKIQCVVGEIEPATIPFGQAQSPLLWDYADQVDTLKFLESLNY